MAYTDSTQISNFLQRSLTAYETAELSNIISAIQTWIDRRLNSTFDSVASSTRYYDGGVRSLDIDPCIDITQVEAINDDGSDSYIYSTTYEIVYEPQNETVKREIRKRLNYFPRGVHRIAVTAKFSEYNQGVPTDIQILATRLVVGVINAGKFASSGGNILLESLEGHEIRYQINPSSMLGISQDDPTVMAILQQRDELYVDNYDQRNEFGYDNDGGLMI